MNWRRASGVWHSVVKGAVAVNGRSPKPDAHAVRRAPGAPRTANGIPAIALLFGATLGYDLAP
jgi:hypothetical protein